MLYGVHMTSYPELVSLRTQQVYACNLRTVAPAVLEYPISGDRLTVLRKSTK